MRLVASTPNSTPKGSAVSGVYSIPREQLDTRTNWFG
jgi:hypothetical protein